MFVENQLQTVLSNQDMKKVKSVRVLKIMSNWIIFIKQINIIQFQYMSNLSNEEILSNLYYDLESGYGSKQSLHNQAKEKGASVTLEEVAKWLKKQPNKQIKPY